MGYVSLDSNGALVIHHAGRTTRQQRQIPSKKIPIEITADGNSASMGLLTFDFKDSDTCSYPPMFYCIARDTHGAECDATFYGSPLGNGYCEFEYPVKFDEFEEPVSRVFYESGHVVKGI